MYELPISVTIGEQSFTIRNKGDYRMVLDCFIALSDDSLSEQEKIITSLIIFYDDFNDIDDVLNKDIMGDLAQEMFKFFNCGQVDDVARPQSHKLIDWEQDSNLICSAVNNVAKKEIRAEEYMHWFTFMGYYLAVGESALSSVVSIRSKIVKGKKLEKFEQDFRRDNPQYFNWNKKTEEDKELENEILKNWHSSGKE